MMEVIVCGPSFEWTNSIKHFLTDLLVKTGQLALNNRNYFFATFLNLKKIIESHSNWCSSSDYDCLYGSAKFC